MSVLRRKLGDDPKEPRYIETVRAVGFRLAGE
jgi:DNA-binding response OmpR family regulator